ncbi:hypothetical protein [Luteolibacter soli]|uniref:Uncharacterized protein n=1 Tax=Luteolibacter soli TaxID=3135280 RepID=A0ABU9AX85_9BACT
MSSYYLMKNGKVECDLIRSGMDRLPREPQHCWHECNIVTTSRVTAGPADVFQIVAAGGEGLPYSVSRCQVGVDGWEIEGQVLF